MMAAKRIQQRKEESKPPVEVERLIGFLNSRPRSDGHPDGLAGGESAAALLDSLGLDGGSLDDVGLERLRRVRDLLAVLADREGDTGGRGAAWDAVNEIAAGVPTVVRFISDDESDVRPTGDGADGTGRARRDSARRVLPAVHAARVPDRSSMYEAHYRSGRARISGEQSWHRVDRPSFLIATAR